jgi:hypothetical protein
MVASLFQYKVRNLFMRKPQLPEAPCTPEIQAGIDKNLREYMNAIRTLR